MRLNVLWKVVATATTTALLLVVITIPVAQGQEGDRVLCYVCNNDPNAVMTFPGANVDLSIIGFAGETATCADVRDAGLGLLFFESECEILSTDPNVQQNCGCTAGVPSTLPPGTTPVPTTTIITTPVAPVAPVPTTSTDPAPVEDVPDTSFPTPLLTDIITTPIPTAPPTIGNIQPEVVPTLPPSTLPPNTIPPSTIPPNTIPPTVPSGILPVPPIFPTLSPMTVTPVTALPSLIINIVPTSTTSTAPSVRLPQSRSQKTTSSSTSRTGTSSNVQSIVAANIPSLPTSQPIEVRFPTRSPTTTSTEYRTSHSTTQESATIKMQTNNPSSLSSDNTRSSPRYNTSLQPTKRPRTKRPTRAENNNNNKKNIPVGPTDNQDIISQWTKPFLSPAVAPTNDQARSSSSNSLPNHNPDTLRITQYPSLSTELSLGEGGGGGFGGGTAADEVFFYGSTGMMTSVNKGRSVCNICKHDPDAVITLPDSLLDLSRIGLYGQSDTCKEIYDAGLACVFLQPECETLASDPNVYKICGCRSQEDLESPKENLFAEGQMASSLTLSEAISTHSDEQFHFTPSSNTITSSNASSGSRNTFRRLLWNRLVLIVVVVSVIGVCI